MVEDFTYKASETEASKINDYWLKEEVFLQAQRPSSPAAMERSGIAVRWSVLLGKFYK